MWPGLNEERRATWERKRNFFTSTKLSSQVKLSQKEKEVKLQETFFYFTKSNLELDFGYPFCVCVAKELRTWNGKALH